MKVSKGKVPSVNNSISHAKETAEKRAKELINFSLKYLQSEKDKFSYHSHEAYYFIEVLERMRNLCLMSPYEFKTNNTDALRAHKIDWNDTSEKSGFGFPKEDEIVDTPFQFSIGSNEHGRVHGFFIDNTFYIVWFDKNHALYPRTT